jgi:uncharacterized membrane protein
MGNASVGMSSNKYGPLAQGLGWFSIGLGLTQILAPGVIANILGVKKRSILFRLLGVREVLSGIGILSKPNSNKKWLASRVAGDVMDLTLLGSALKSTRNPGGALAATAAVVGVTALDVVCTRNTPSKDSDIKETGIHVRKSVTINRPATDLYAFWRDLPNLPLFMNHLESIHVMDEKKSHWVVSAPAGMVVEWDAEIIHDEPNVLIAWRSLEGSKVEHAGTVRFEPALANRGTIVKVEFQYRPPAGVLGSKVAKLFGESPEQQVDIDLRQFKQLMETGEVTTTVGQPAGRVSSTSKKFDYVTESKAEKVLQESNK